MRINIMALSELKDIRKKFLECFKDYGCREEPASKISSGVDPTVFFVGSTTNSLKQYILGDIPEKGIVADQPSMRFRETKYLYDNLYRPTYGAFFNELGVITPPVNAMGLCTQLHNYFIDYLGIEEDNLVARVSSKDNDLLKLAEGTFSNIEVNSRPEKYYRHVIGEEGYLGKNFNIAIKNNYNENFEDVGNFLIFQKNSKDNFFEIGLGDTVIQKPLKSYDHVLDCYNVSVPKKLIKIESLNYINATIVSSVLYGEGLRASNKTSQERLLAKYIRYLSLLKLEGKVTYMDIGNSAQSFEQSYYGQCSHVSDDIVYDLQQKEGIFRKTLIEQKLLIG